MTSSGRLSVKRQRQITPDRYSCAISHPASTNPAKAEDQLPAEVQAEVQAAAEELKTENDVMERTVAFTSPRHVFYARCRSQSRGI